MIFGYCAFKLDNTLRFVGVGLPPTLDRYITYFKTSYYTKLNLFSASFIGVRL